MHVAPSIFSHSQDMNVHGIEAILQDFTKTLSKFTNVKALLLAVSGGSDSLAMMHLAAHWSRQLAESPKIAVATIDHGLRPESAAECAFVAAESEKLGFECFQSQWTGAKPASQIIEQARSIRYELLYELAVSWEREIKRPVSLMVGHTLDDHFETLRMRLARGVEYTSGGFGLAGISTSVLFENMMVIRPILKMRRTDLRHWLQTNGINNWIEDPTNADRTYERPRIRASEPDDQYQIDLLNFSGVIERWRSLVCAQAFEFVTNCVEHVAAHIFKLPAHKFCQLAFPVRRYVLSVLLALAGGSERLVTGKALDDLAAHPKSQTIAHAVFDFSRAEQIWIFRENRNIPEYATNGIWDGRFKVSNDQSVCTFSKLDMETVRKEQLKFDSSMPIKALMAQPYFADKKLGILKPTSRCMVRFVNPIDTKFLDWFESKFTQS